MPTGIQRARCPPVAPRSSSACRRAGCQHARHGRLRGACSGPCRGASRSRHSAHRPSAPKRRRSRFLTGRRRLHHQAVQAHGTRSAPEKTPRLLIDGLAARHVLFGGASRLGLPWQPAVRLPGLTSVSNATWLGILMCVELTFLRVPISPPGPKRSERHGEKAHNNLARSQN